MTGLISPDAGWIVAAAVPVALAMFAAQRKAGQLEQKVDGLQAQLKEQEAAWLRQVEAQARVLEGLVARLEQLGDKFTDHAVADATHFGELRGMLRPAQS